jgi:hypothetical protein
MNVPDETCFRDWPADWLVVAFPHALSLDPRLVRAISAIASGSTLEANGTRIGEIGAVVDDPMRIAGAVMRLSDASGEWEVLCSNVGSFSLLGATPSVMSLVFDPGSRAGLREEFEAWVKDSRIGFGHTGLAFASDHLLPILRRP